jgi:5,10-methylenetetrahydrofolate reductase
VNSSVPSGGRTFLEAIRKPGPFVTVELRPPRTGLSYKDSMDVWIDMYHSIQRLVRKGRTVFLTDNAVGTLEEENLAHLTSNLPDGVSASQLVPFLTCKHTLDYCMLYASRAESKGFEALTVLGGDKFAGPPRCLPHAYLLRDQIRQKMPGLSLGGWLNPHRPPEEQLGFIESPNFTADFVLTQVVSHHSVQAVAETLEQADKRGIDLPMIFGVFLYRSANPKTLARLGDYFPVPGDELTQEFEAGDSADEICARTIRELRKVGADKIYVSNLGFSRVENRLARVLAQV